MESLNGFNAYRTYLSMVLHFRRGSYDGWKFNFNGKMKSETYEKKRSVIHRYTALESRYPTKNDQICFYYPAFAKFGYVKEADIGVFKFQNLEFNKRFNELMDSVYQKELKTIALRVKNIDELIGLDGQTPFLYNCYIEKEISYESLVLLRLAIPSINKVVSKETFLWQSLLEKTKFDSKFYELYLSDKKETLISNTIATLMDAWKLKR